MAQTLVYERRHGEMTLFEYGEALTAEIAKARPYERPKPIVGNTLTVKNIDLMIPVNSKAHRTNFFAVTKSPGDGQRLVVRRGQPFLVNIKFSRPYDEKTDKVKLVFTAGPKPITSDGTYVELTPSNEDKGDKWGAKIVSREGDVLTINISTPAATCYVAKWSFLVDVIRKENTGVSVYRYKNKSRIYILFNPWCKSDPVYMEDEKLLNEYILNAYGILFMGSVESITQRPWYYGQFDSNMLSIALDLMDKSNLSWGSRGNSILIGREISALVNHPDDAGVMEGKWEGSFSKGTPPDAWTGSPAILEQYAKTRSPVKYGQCWVFAAVATTVCRALGIPARSVTNFISAHDTNGSITVDYFVKPDGKIEKPKDSVWNFHVWTEIWTTRPDLPPGYGGWQVIDATPQERSNGIYACGPASVKAMKCGEVRLPFDGPFVFSEINADTLYWKPNARGVIQCISNDCSYIGKFISTKAANSNEREDITNNYKLAEGTPEERAVVINANLHGSTDPKYYKPKATDVQFSIEQNSANTWVGDNFVVILKAKNNSKEKRSVNGRIVISTMLYTGITADTLKSEPLSLNLAPGEEKVQKVIVTPDVYEPLLKDKFMVDVFTMATVEETKQVFAKKMDYTMRKPSLTAKAPREVKMKQQFTIDVSFKNPRNVTLTDCSLTVDGIVLHRIFPQANVPAKGNFATTVAVDPKHAGKGEIILNFNSKQLREITTTCPLLVQKV